MRDVASQFVIAESEGKLVGVVGLELYGESALLRSAAVEESWRGSGVGRVLVERALDVARQARHRRCLPAHHHRGTLLPALRVFLREPRFGDSGVKASIEFQEACPASATVMRKSLEAMS